MMPRRRASRRRSKKQLIFKILLLGVALIVIGLVVYFASAFLNKSEKAKDTEKTQTHVVNPKKDPEEKKETESQSISKTPTSNFDLTALASGDYHSAAGTWKNEEGDSLTLNATGLESASIQNVTDFTLAVGQPAGDDGIYQASLTSADGNTVYNLLFVKAGTTIPETYFTEGYSDKSDTSRDRLYLTNQPTFGGDDFNKGVLYKTN